ncbi:Bug family tripartite tricarboxylate transporter substrate binding protein [Pseudorhodoferax sp.]|uniref:Bug family tripartite tricarboxylate transporter substrate binding protein n=1 Tax=Pseudorhodoferax sp. TaxID=1993553 RepID=UPI0039E39ACD
MQRSHFHRLAIGAVLAGSSLLAWGGQPAAWPTRPVRLVVGFPAGSTPDAAARALADGLAGALGQPVIVENRAGASGNLAAGVVAKAADDHTLGVVINGNLTTARLLNPGLSYDPARDFAYLSLLTTAPLALVTRADLPAGPAFFAAARAQGERWSYGSVGSGSVAHLGMEWLKSRMPGLAPVHVPFQGNPGVVTALIGGHIEMALVPPGIAAPHVQSGRLRFVGLTSGRSTLAPQVPSLGEMGVQDFNLEVWTALVGPAGLSRAAQQRLAEAVPEVLRAAEVRQRLFQQGWNAVGSAPEGLRARVAEESAAFRRLIQSARIQAE